MSTIYLFVSPGLRRTGVALFKQSAMGGGRPDGSFVLGLSKGELHAAAAVENVVPAKEGRIAEQVGMAQAVRTWARAACAGTDGYRCIGGYCAPEIIVFESFMTRMPSGHAFPKHEVIVGAIAALYATPEEDGCGCDLHSVSESWASFHRNLTKEAMGRLSKEEKANVPRSPKGRASPIVLHTIAFGLHHLGRLDAKKEGKKRS